MKRFFVSIALTAGLLVLAGSPAWADPIPSTDVQWSYNFTPSKSILSASPSGSVSFTTNPTTKITGNSDIVLTNLTASSTASVGTPDAFSNTAWSGVLTLTDKATGLSHDMTFSGVFNGSIAASRSTIANTFTGQQSQTWDLGNGTHYTVTAGSFTPPGAPTSQAGTSGSIGVHVQTTGTASHSPEPSTLLLSCLGLGFAGAASWRKKRRAAATPLV